jgi:DNA replication and repair protein RecF
VIVRSLQLTDFRNYSSLQLELGAGVHALIGDNAQGKTNLVEALQVLLFAQTLCMTTIENFW